MNAAWLIILPALVGQAEIPIKVEQTDTYIQIETDALKARINKKGYVSGIAAGTFLDKKTGAKDLGFGLHIMDFLLGPGWKDDGYQREPKYHGNLPHHYIEGPQICTQAKMLTPQVIQGNDFLAVTMSYRFTQGHNGFKAGSVWEQTLVFLPGKRWMLCGEKITSANDVDHLIYRIDMPGHVKHKDGDTFNQVYLSYHGTIPAKDFTKDFPPDGKYLYQHQSGKVPERMIRAYQIKQGDQRGPWLAGMTLDPSLVHEAWCHQRGYICFIEELFTRRIKAGQSFGAAYIVGYFDTVAEMNGVFDQYRGVREVEVRNQKLETRK